MSHSLRIVCMFLALGLAGCASKIVVRPIEHAPKADGIIYALPKTVISTTVTITRTKEKPGIYAGYAPCFFPESVEDITFTSTDRIDVTDASFTSRGIPDPDQVFVIDTTAGWLNKKTLDAQLTEGGLLTKSSVEVKNEALSFTISTVKSAAAIAGSLLPVTSAFRALAAGGEGAASDRDAASCLATLQGLKGDDSVSGSASFRKALQELTDIQNGRTPLDTSQFARAFNVFDKMKALIAGHEVSVSSSLQGDVSPDGLKELAAEYNDSLSQYSGYFLGTVTTDKWVPGFDSIPDNLAGNNNFDGATLFTYRSTPDQQKPAGVCIDPHHPEVVPNRKFTTIAADQCADAALTAVRTALSFNPAAQISHGAALDPQHRNEKRGYYFRIPASVGVTLEKGATPIATSNLLLAQWGKVMSLPADVGSSRSKYQVELSGTTGALTNFSMDTDARLENADFSGLESAAKSITDPIAASKDKLKNLQNAEQTLETQCKINAIKKINDPNLDCSSVVSSK